MKPAYTFQLFHEFFHEILRNWLIFGTHGISIFPVLSLVVFSSGAEVTQIGPGRVAVEVLIDGPHESRSEPRIFLEVMPVTWSIHRFMDGFYIFIYYIYIYIFFPLVD